MLRRRSGDPGWRWLCKDTVTVYRREKKNRQVIANVYFDNNVSERVSAGAATASTGFLLVIPGSFDISPGDKVVRGVGPAGRWENLNSADVPGLGVVKSVTQRMLAGSVSHTEVRGS